MDGRFLLAIGDRGSERKRLEAKLQQRKQTLRARMHELVAQVGEWLSRVLRGYYNYHGAPGNRASLNRFRERLMGLLVACARKTQPAGTPGGRAEAITGRALHPLSGPPASLSASAL
ncbi:MAG: hypothetical protein IT170_15805 [Bryobacterales bacterium]|nr:hypothetical protein [Bryobacterales bacterium]